MNRAAMPITRSASVPAPLLCRRCIIEQVFFIFYASFLLDLFVEMVMELLVYFRIVALKTSELSMRRWLPSRLIAVTGGSVEHRRSLRLLALSSASGRGMSGPN